MEHKCPKEDEPKRIESPNTNLVYCPIHGWMIPDQCEPSDDGKLFERSSAKETAAPKAKKTK